MHIGELQLAEALRTLLLDRSSHPEHPGYHVYIYSHFHLIQ